MQGCRAGVQRDNGCDVGGAMAQCRMYSGTMVQVCGVQQYTT